MTDLQDALAQIKGRAEKATEGPWVPLGNTMAGEVKTCTCAGNIPGCGHEPYCGLDGPLITGAAPVDVEFIAHARTDVPRLLAAIEAVLKLLKEPEEWRVYDTRDMGDAYAVDTVKDFIGDIRDALTDKLGGEDDE